MTYNPRVYVTGRNGSGLMDLSEVEGFICESIPPSTQFDMEESLKRNGYHVLSFENGSILVSAIGQEVSTF